jgi:serine/threonine protein kinase
LFHILNDTQDLWILLRRCVALKIIVSRLANSNEIEILQYLRDAPQLKNHPGREHISGLLDHFRVSGPNGTHNVLVFDVVGPGPDELRTGYEVGEEFVWKWSRIISKEVALGIAYLHELGVTHGGMVFLLSSDVICHDFVDLHGWNIAFSLPDLKGLVSDAVFAEYLNPPCMQRVPANDNVSWPKYLVEPGSFANYMVEAIERNGGQFPWKIKIIDFGEGGSLPSSVS